MTLRGSEIPLSLTIARAPKRVSFTVGIATVAVGMLSVACSSTETPAPTSTTTTTTTTTSSASHHDKHESSGGGGGAPVQTETVAPSTVTNTETDVQTTVQTSVATETQTVTATPTWQQRDPNGRSDNRNQFGSPQGH